MENQFLSINLYSYASKENMFHFNGVPVNIYVIVNKMAFCIKRDKSSDRINSMQVELTLTSGG